MSCTKKMSSRSQEHRTEGRRSRSPRRSTSNREELKAICQKGHIEAFKTFLKKQLQQVEEDAREQVEKDVLRQAVFHGLRESSLVGPIQVDFLIKILKGKRDVPINYISFGLVAQSELLTPEQKGSLFEAFALSRSHRTPEIDYETLKMVIRDWQRTSSDLSREAKAFGVLLDDQRLGEFAFDASLKPVTDHQLVDLCLGRIHFLPFLVHDSLGPRAAPVTDDVIEKVREMKARHHISQPVLDSLMIQLEMKKRQQDQVEESSASQTRDETSHSNSIVHKLKSAASQLVSRLQQRAW